MPTVLAQREMYKHVQIMVFPKKMAKLTKSLRIHCKRHMWKLVNVRSMLLRQIQSNNSTFRAGRVRETDSFCFISAICCNVFIKASKLESTPE